jgi:hypothetical protein
MRLDKPGSQAIQIALGERMAFLEASSVPEDS